MVNTFLYHSSYILIFLPKSLFSIALMSTLHIGVTHHIVKKLLLCSFFKRNFWQLQCMDLHRFEAEKLLK